MRLAARNDLSGLSATPGNGEAVANYIATMAADLATMARANRLDGLGYLLDMARLEAETLARNLPDKN